MKTSLFFLILILTFVSSETVSAQFYPTRFRVPGQNWQELRTDHFRVIYPAGFEETAGRAAAILEREYPRVRDLTGGTLSRFPVILNTTNDRSNGFVSAINFRSEIDISPIGGKSMNPASGDWLELVLAHELVHASHYNATAPGPTSVVSLFSPDLRRAVHSAAPFGLFEGLAVEYESHGLRPGGGRGNYPWFANQFSSIHASGDPWSMGQLIHLSSRTRPFNRHYIGGYAFIHWLQDRYGEETMKSAISTHFSLPFLGFGYALKETTGSWPSRLYKQFAEQMTNENRDMERFASAIDAVSPERLPDAGKGPVWRHPVWLDNNRLVLHGQFYNRPTGFYIYDRRSGDFSLLHETRIVEDFQFEFDPVEGALYYAAYEANPLYNDTYHSVLYRLSPAAGRPEKLNSGNRLFAPVPGPTLYALQPDRYRNRIVRVDADTGAPVPTGPLPLPFSVQEMDIHPANDSLFAVIMNTGSAQALWTGRLPDLTDRLTGDPDISVPDGSLFDIDWHPAERKLLFSSDHTGTQNLYEYDLDRQTVRTVSRGGFNAFEASYSPDGKEIAFVYLDGNSYRVALMTLPDISGDETLRNETEILLRDFVSGRSGGGLLSPGTEPDPRLYRHDVEADTGSWRRGNYSSGFNWLAPRLMIPLVEDLGADTYKIGAILAGTDLLGGQSYNLSMSVLHRRPWYDLWYRNSQFFPGFRFRLFNEPSIATFSGGQDGPFHFLLQERGASLQIPAMVTLERNTRQSTLRVTPGYEYSEQRFLTFDQLGRPLSTFSGSHMATLNIGLNWKLRQFSRDVQPNAGFRLFAQAEAGLSRREFFFVYDNFLFEGGEDLRRGIYGGLSTYVAPIARWNQSLQLGIRFLSQSETLVYNTDDIRSDMFSTPIFPNAQHIGSFNTRYTIPLLYPDDGGVTLPAYLGTVYLAIYSQTLGNLNQGSFSDILSASRTAVGAGLRVQARLSNLSFDIGIGFGYEITRRKWNLMVGQF